MGAQWNIINKNYKNLEGYKRVAWPPASEERIVREFTPQPQQSPAPGSGGYYQQQHQQQPTAAAAAAAPSASSLNAAPAQGPIYNNVQPRTQQQQPQQYQQPQQQQQYYQQPQQPAQNVYGPNTNYASNGYAPAAATVAAPQDPNNYPQQPIQYTQAQFNRQPSREPVADNYATYAQPQQQQQQPPQQQQQHYQPTYPQQQQQQQPPLAVDNVGGGWKHIGAPQPKSHQEFTAGGVAPTSAYPSYQQQQQQPQQQQQQYQYQPQVAFG